MIALAYPPVILHMCRAVLCRASRAGTSAYEACLACSRLLTTLLCFLVSRSHYVVSCRPVGPRYHAASFDSAGRRMADTWSTHRYDLHTGTTSSHAVTFPLSARPTTQLDPIAGIGSETWRSWHSQATKQIGRIQSRRCRTRPVALRRAILRWLYEGEAVFEAKGIGRTPR